MKTTVKMRSLLKKIKRQYKVVFGSFLMLLAVGLLVAFISFFIYGQDDQSLVEALGDRNEPASNWLGKGAYVLSRLAVNAGLSTLTSRHDIGRERRSR